MVIKYICYFYHAGGHRRQARELLWNAPDIHSVEFSGVQQRIGVVSIRL